ncbi:MAG: hypoxanthine phosphoribosyltransferase [Lachnospiraceae bacterium]|nr:hypoxanthine phosphoribosyltransferase [Lachnospiraceae bacterium]
MKRPKEFISEEKINETVDRIASEINKDYEGKDIRVICILKGSIYFATELTKRLKSNVTLDFMQVSSYGNGTTPGDLVIKQDLDRDIKGLDCIVVEDIIDTGKTMHVLKEELNKREPNSLKVCAFLDKPSRREVELKADYIGLEIPDEFVVGFGMDYAEHYRNLPYIGVLHNDNE